MIITQFSYKRKRNILKLRNLSFRRINHGVTRRKRREEGDESDTFPTPYLQERLLLQKAMIS
jgi:hypothetical protein